MRDKDGFWISKKSIPDIIYTYLSTSDIPKDYLTSNIDEAKVFNWFTFGFVKFMLDSYGISTREAFVQYLKI